jgi:hypothetical protein
VTALDFDRTVVDLPPEGAEKLRRLNLAAGSLHLATAVLMVVLGDRNFSLPVSGFNISGPPGTELSEGVLTELFSVPLAWAVASFSLLSAVFHFLVASGGYAQYRRELERGRNRFRWLEYASTVSCDVAPLPARQVHLRGHRARDRFEATRYRDVS